MLLKCIHTCIRVFVWACVWVCAYVHVLCAFVCVQYVFDLRGGGEIVHKYIFFLKCV